MCPARQVLALAVNGAGVVRAVSHAGRAGEMRMDRAERGGELAGQLVWRDGGKAGAGDALRDQGGVLQGGPDGVEGKTEADRFGYGLVVGALVRVASLPSPLPSPAKVAGGTVAGLASPSPAFGLGPRSGPRVG